MSKKDPRVDAYILKSGDFAKPILEYFRALVHKTCKESVETIKWGFPHFMYKGKNMCYMASFKKHCAIGFWKAALMKQSEDLLKQAAREESMGHLGKISTINDLPKAAMITSLIKEAMRVNELDMKVPKHTKPSKKAVLKVPTFLSDALFHHPDAAKQFALFSPSQKKEFVNWLEEAKTESTRLKRLDTALTWMSEGKDRHWKYKKQ
jgi:uncharacterized protein YdeI (YjbR/CyaY-like superfamily)